MAKEQAPAPQIVARKRRRHVAPHGGVWKVAYADFVTAMMALFILLWVMSQGESMVQGVTTYFKDPTVRSVRVARTVQGSVRGSVQYAPPSNQEWKELQKQKLKEMGDQLMLELSRSTEFKGLMDQIKVEIVNEGLRIELLESADDMFFGIGTSTLKEKAQALIKKIGVQLALLPNKLVVEGHTDSRPYSGGVLGYSNFELSAERANIARRILIEAGVAEQVIDEVRGYADRRLRLPEDPLSFMNRRISIIVKYSEPQ